MRHLRRIKASDRANMGQVLDLDPNSIEQRAEDWMSKLGEGRKLIKIAHDATKLKPRVSLHRGRYIVGLPANDHLIDYAAMRDANEDTATEFLVQKMKTSKEDLAPEVKCSILLSQSAKEGIYPAKLLCCRPQTTNEVKFVFRKHRNLVSYSYLERRRLSSVRFGIRTSRRFDFKPKYCRGRCS